MPRSLRKRIYLGFRPDEVVAHVKLHRRWQSLPFVLYTFLVFIGLAIKAGTASITHDESLSYLKFVYTGELLQLGDANNHFLNTLLMYASSNLFGISELALRLPNLGCYLIYAVFAYKTLLSVKNYEIRVLGFFMLNAVPFVLDFFSLARGYGISLSLFLGYVYYLQQYLKTGKAASLLFSLLLITAACTAVMTFVYFVGFITCMAGYHLLIKRNSGDRAKYILAGTIMAISILTLAGFSYIGRTLIQLGSFYSGEPSLAISLLNLAGYSICEMNKPDWPVTAALIALLYLFVRKLYTRRKPGHQRKFFQEPIALYIILALFATTGLVLQHYLMGTNYPPARALQFYIPLFILMLVHWLDQLSRTSRMWLAIGFALLTGWNIVLGAHVNHFLLWGYDAQTKTHFGHIKQHRDTLTTVTAHPLYRPTFNFYSLINKTNLYIVQDANPQYTSDFVINTAPDGYTGYQVVSEGISTLMKNERNLQKWPEVQHYQIIDTLSAAEGVISGEYPAGRKYSIPDSVQNSAMVVVDFTAHSQDRELLNAHFVVNCQGGRQTGYHNGLLSLHRVTQEDYHFRQGFWLSPEELAGSEVALYVWNVDKQSFVIRDLKVTWYRSEF